MSQHQLPDPETGLLFERMVSQLPESFKYESYPNVTLFIGHLILQSELKGERLVKEMDQLTDQVSQRLVETQEARELLTLLKDYRLLKRLFALELTPEDFEAFNHRIEAIRPEKVFIRFLELNQTKRVENIEFSHGEEIDSLFEKALEFYRGVTARDQWMLQNIEARLRETGESKAVVITGGFHAEPFTDYFKQQGYNYALIAPKITTIEGKEAYIEATLQNVPPQFIKATRETVFPYGLFLRQARLEGVNPAFSLDKLIGTELGVAERNGVLFEMDGLAQGPTSNNFGLSYRTPVKGPGGKEGVLVAVDLRRLTAGRKRGVQEVFLPFGEKRMIRRVVIEEEAPSVDLTGLRRRIRQQVLEPVREGTPQRFYEAPEKSVPEKVLASQPPLRSEVRADEKNRTWKKWAYGAAAILLFGTGIYIGITGNPFGARQQQGDVPQQIIPGQPPVKKPDKVAPGGEITQVDYARVANTGDVEAVKAYIKRFYRIRNEGNLSGFAPHYTKFVEGVSNPEPGKHLGDFPRPVEDLIKELDNADWAERLERPAPKQEQPAPKMEKKQEEAPTKVEAPKTAPKTAVELAKSVPVKGISFNEFRKSYEKVAETGDVEAVKTFIRRIADISNEGDLSGFAPHYTKFVEGVSNPEAGRHRGDFPRPLSDLLRELDNSSWAKVHKDTPRSEVRAKRLIKSIVIGGIGAAILATGIFVGSLFKPNQVVGPQQPPVVVENEQKPIQDRAPPVKPVQPPDQQDKKPDTPKEIIPKMEYKVAPETIRFFQKHIGGVGNYITDPQAGVHGPTGAPRDHVRLDAKGQVANVGDYGSPSKDGVYLPTLVLIYQKNPVTSQIKVSPDVALDLILKDLRSLREFQKDYEGKEVYGGLFPWYELRPDGTRRLTQYGGRKMVPSLDNGQTTLGGLVVVAGAFWDAPKGSKERQVRDLALEVLKNQDYKKWVNPRTGRLYAEWSFDQDRGVPGGGEVLFWTEWSIPAIYAYLNGDMTQEGWLSQSNQTFVWDSPAGKLDMPQMYRFSAPEHWIIQYLGKTMMKSKLAPLYLNTVYARAQWARDNNIPGFSGVEYRADGTYVSSGPKLKGLRILGPIEDDQMATPYGTALDMIIHPRAADWMQYLLEQPGMETKYGFPTSFTRKYGASKFYTGDGFTTLNAMAEWHSIVTNQKGGINDAIINYFAKKDGITFEESERRIIRAFDLHAEAILKRLGRDQFLTIEPARIPGPPEKRDYSVEKQVEKVIGEKTTSLSSRLQMGHWHSESATWKKEALRDGEIVADYNMVRKDYAFVGTYLKPELPIAAKDKDKKDVYYRSISFWVPADLKNENWQIEIKNGNREIAARVPVKTSPAGHLSKDGKWKRIVVWFEPNNAAIEEKLPANYIAVSTNITRSGGRKEGKFHLRDIQLHLESQEVIEKERPEAPGKIVVPRSEVRTDRYLDEYRALAQSFDVRVREEQIVQESKRRSEVRKEIKFNFNPDPKNLHILGSFEGITWAEIPISQSPENTEAFRDFITLLNEAGIETGVDNPASLQSLGGNPRVLIAAVPEKQAAIQPAIAFERPNGRILIVQFGEVEGLYEDDYRNGYLPLLMDTTRDVVRYDIGETIVKLDAKFSINPEGTYAIKTRSEVRSVKKWLVRVGIPAAVVSTVVGGYYMFTSQQPVVEEKGPAPVEQVRPAEERNIVDEVTINAVTVQTFSLPKDLEAFELDAKLTDLLKGTNITSEQIRKLLPDLTRVGPSGFTFDGILFFGKSGEKVVVGVSGEKTEFRDAQRAPFAKISYGKILYRPNPQMALIEHETGRLKQIGSEKRPGYIGLGFTNEGKIVVEPERASAYILGQDGRVEAYVRQVKVAQAAPAQERQPVENVDVLLQQLKEENSQKRIDAAQDIQKLLTEKKATPKEQERIIQALVDSVENTARRVVTVGDPNTEFRVLSAIEKALVSAGSHAIEPVIRKMNEAAEKKEGHGHNILSASATVLKELKATDKGIPAISKILTDEKFEKIEDVAISSRYFYARASLSQTLQDMGDEKAVPALAQTINRQIEIRPGGNPLLGGNAVNGLIKLLDSNKIKDQKLKIQAVQALTDAVVKTPGGIGSRRDDIIKTFREQLRTETDRPVREAIESAIKQITPPKEEKPSRSEVRSVERAINIAPIIEREITPAVMKNFEGPMDKTLLSRFETLGRAFQEVALKTLGVEPAFAQATVFAPVDFTKIDQEVSTLGNIKGYFPPRAESQPTSPRALYDYQGVFSENPKDYDLLILLAASDRNLKLTLWLDATEDQLVVLQTKLTQYAQSRYGFYPQNLKIELTPQNIIGELFARARKGKLPTGFVSSDRNILPQVNAGRGVILAAGSSQTTSQNLTATLLAKRLLSFPPDQLDPRIYTGEDLAEGRWAELVAFLEARQAMLAAA